MVKIDCPKIKKFVDDGRKWEGLKGKILLVFLIRRSSWILWNRVRGWDTNSCFWRRDEMIFEIKNRSGIFRKSTYGFRKNSTPLRREAWMKFLLKKAFCEKKNMSHSWEFFQYAHDRFSIHFLRSRMMINQIFLAFHEYVFRIWKAVQVEELHTAEMI